MDSLQRDLEAAVAGEVDFSARRRAEYSSDASNYRLAPTGVVFPRDADDVVAAVAVCRDHDVPITPRGGGTSIAGNAIGTGIVLEFSRHMNRILAIDVDARTARVQAGVIPDDLNAAVAADGLRFGPDPSTHARCTIGGMIGNDSCGSHSVAWGRTSDNVVDLDVVTYDGTRMTVSSVADAGPRTGPLAELVATYRAVLRTELGRFPRQVSGYGLHHLLAENGGDLARALVGTEGTCVIVLGATVRLVELPRRPRMIVAGFADSVAAADAVPAILENRPLTCEGMDDRILDVLRARRPDSIPDVLPDGQAWLLIDVDGDLPASIPGAIDTSIVDDPVVRRAILKIREDGSGLATRGTDGTMSWPGWEDAAVPPANLGAYLRGFHALLDKFGLTGVVYGHFGEGCLHVRLDFDLATDAGVEHFDRFLRAASKLAVDHGGALSGEHGDGRARSAYLSTMYSDTALEAFSAFKRIWDPDGRLNPGVLVDPAPATADLRQHAAIQVTPTSLGLPGDSGDLAVAAHRCIGVAKCRTGSGGVMCPSYRATRDEKDSTRGRARVLQEMVRGETVTDGWASPEVGEALELCLSCKGCKSDCPVGVDMASYKAEYLYQAYKGKRRPASHYTMGWLPVAARAASRMPTVVNRLMSRTPAAMKRAAGIAPERDLPEFAATTFLRQWASRRVPSVPNASRRVPSVPETTANGTKTVALWPDTFTNFFAPQIGLAAVEVLQAAGYNVVVPSTKPRCCGLTWLSTGQLPMARRQLRHALDAVSPLLDEGMDLVVLEPSCLALLRSDAVDLLPDDPRATAASEHAVSLAEFLHRADWEPPELTDELAVQVHCHQHAIIGSAADEAVLGSSARVLDGGCCGLAGNFGFEDGHYDVSVRIAELGPLAALASTPDAAVVADGFSCRTQFAQVAGLPSRHLAEIVADALRRR